MSSDNAHWMPPITASDVKKNEHLMIKGRPTKVVDIAKSKTGKHGHMKCTITGIDIFNGKKYQDLQPGHANMYSALVEKKEYQLMVIDGGFAKCLDDDNNEYEVPLEGEVAQKLAEEFNPDDDETTIISVVKAPLGDSPDNATVWEQIASYKKQKD